MIFTSPVIVIGMHRSGTSVVARLLSQLGMFVGAKTDENSEAFFFLNLNDWLLRQSGGDWDYPAPIDRLLANNEIRSLAVDYLRTSFNSRKLIKYLGLWRYLELQAGSPAAKPWGWKDPRNTFTLPLWLEIFPDARVVYVARHGVDVAHSLHKRSRRGLEWGKKRRYELGKGPSLVSVRRPDLTDSVRCLSHGGGFSLWEEYSRRAVQHVTDLGSRAITVRYEDLLQKPDETLRALAVFCGLPGVDREISRCISLLDTDRAYAYLSDDGLKRLAEQHSEGLQALGY